MSNYKDLEKRRETQRKWLAANKDRLREHMREYHREYQRRYREKTPGQREKERAARKEYYARNRDAEQKKAREYMRVYYAEHKDEMDAKNRGKYRKRRKWFDEQLARVQCSHCGLKDPECMDYHHVNPADKDYSITQMLAYSVARLEKEMAKCIVLCANCHRKEHARLRREQVIG